MVFFELSFDRAVVLDKVVMAPRSLAIIFWLGEDCLRIFAVEELIFSLGFVWTWKGLLIYLTGLRCIADLLFITFLSNFGLLSTFLIFFSLTST